MTKKILVAIGLLGAGALTSSAHAQSAAPATSDKCSLGESAKTDAERVQLTSDKAKLTERRTRLADELSMLRATAQPDAKAIAELSDKIELNGIALTNVEAALKLITTLETSLAECRAADKRLKLVGRIPDLRADDADRKAAEAAETAIINAKLEAARDAEKKLFLAQSATESYAKLALRTEQLVPVAPAPSPPVRQAENSTGADKRAGEDDCDLMIDAPAPTLRIGTCAGKSRVRAARSLAGGDVAFPSSVLRPRGITANLTGGSSDGTVSLSYADSFRFRRTPQNLPESSEARVQLPWEWGYSFGVSAKDGIIFDRDDPDTSITDTLDGKATAKLGFFFNVFEGETLKDWRGDAAQLREEVIEACVKDQASGKSKTPSTCTGQSLTDWVFDSGEKGALRPDLAQKVNALYFSSEDDKAKWGLGIDFSFSRSNFDYLDPAVFIANPDAKNSSDGEWSRGATLYGFLRFTNAKAPVGISAVPSISYSSRFGYPEGTTEKQFCPALTAGTRFVTGACPTYYDTPPERIRTWTPALELRFLTEPYKFFPPLGISPKISRLRVRDSRTDRWEFALPALAFVESETGLGVGLQYSREWGGRSDIANDDGIFEKIDPEDSLKIVISKTFSLSGK